MGQSKANSGIVHAGFDAPVGSLKAKFNVRGNKMMPNYARELGVKYRNAGSLVVAFSYEDMRTLEELKKRGEINGVPDLEIIGGDALKKLEPNISANALGALYAKTGGIVCPYELTIAAIGNAMDNGADLFTDFDVNKILIENGVFNIYSASGKCVQAARIVNAAGINSAYVAALCGDTSFTVHGRKGEYILLDRESGDFVNHTLFFTPTKAGKGVLISQTVDNNIILGPTAQETENPSTDTTAEGLAFVAKKASEMCENVPFYNAITSFCGVRAYSDRHDFIVEESAACEGLINCAGIESPGLTSAPAIAEYVVNEIIGKKTALVKNPDFNGKRRADCFFKDLSTEEKNELIKRDPSYGRIICRCEQITEGEIIAAVRNNPKAESIDAVKRRTRAGMGRCQGSFCQAYVAEIIAKEKGVTLAEITKSGRNSYLVVGKTK